MGLKRRKADSFPQSMFSLLAESQKEGSHILCFDGEHRVTFSMKQAEEMAHAIFGFRPVVGEPLAEGLKEVIAKLGAEEGLEGGASRKSLNFTLADGSSVCLRLARDSENHHHCLIFDCESVLHQPEQLHPLELSRRETEVAFWILQRKTSWEIGKILHLSPRTVEKHTQNIWRKLQISNRAELAAKAQQICEL
jgi:DNA-binding CsgD family transcriptional regulator